MDESHLDKNENDDYLYKDVDGLLSKLNIKFLSLYEKVW